MQFVRTMCVSAVCALFAASAFAQTYDEVREAQTLLYQADYNPGPIDGEWGRRTEGALINFMNDQGLEYDGELSQNELELLRAAPIGENYASVPYTTYGRPIRHSMAPNGVITFYQEAGAIDELPQMLNPPPNDATLEHYFFNWLSFERLSVRTLVGDNPRGFSFNTRESEYLRRQLRFSSVLSYLMYEDGEIIYDYRAPDDRFDLLSIDDSTRFRSQSVGKSMTAYLLGHAICQGYVDGISETLSDWPLVENTAYAPQSLMDLLNMRARDQHIIDDSRGFIGTDRWYNITPLSIRDFASQELLNTLPNREQVYNYNGFVTNLILNYLVYKTGDDWQYFLSEVVHDYVGMNYPFLFLKGEDPLADGSLRYMFHATRYDYLRFAIAMLEDWQNDTCVGRYLRTLYENRQPKHLGWRNPQREASAASYGGQFHFDLPRLEDRPIFLMHGAGGQNVAIDMDAGRIIVINSGHTDLDWQTLVYEAIRDGTLPD